MSMDEQLKQFGFPNEEVMRMLSQVALRQATETVAKHARQFAEMPGMDEISGRDALLAFANSMLNTSDSVWGKKQ